MKKSFFYMFFFCVFLIFSTNGNAQTDVRNSMIYRLQKAVYNRALKYNDVNLAINALYNLCNLEPQNDSLLYALEYLYFDNGQFISAALVANDVMMLNPENLAAHEIKAVCLEQLGAKDKAIEEYESLYLKKNDVNFLYKVAYFQFEIQRYRESKTNLDILLTKKEVDEVKLIFTKPDNTQQEIPMRASLHNLKGMVEKALGNTEEAKKQYGIALEMAQDFSLARQNLDELLNPSK